MKHRSLAGVLLASASAIAAMPPSAAVASAQASPPTVVFHIDEQPVQTALTQFARQAGLRILFPYDQVTGLRSRAVTGAMAPRAALERLISGTSLRVAMVRGNVVALSLANSGPVAARPVNFGQTTPIATPAAQSATPPVATSPADNQVTTSSVADSDVVPDIVVVGSQIRGSKATEALPVTIVTQAQIANTAAVSGEELFRDIPQMGSLTFNSQYLSNSSNSARGDAASVNLRELGAGNTLVLLNGRRVVQHPASQADENLVPVISYNSNAHPRVGVRPAGGAARWCSGDLWHDAVAGVVNTVLKDEYQRRPTRHRNMAMGRALALPSRPPA